MSISVTQAYHALHLFDVVEGQAGDLGDEQECQNEGRDNDRHVGESVLPQLDDPQEHAGGLAVVEEALHHDSG